MKSYKKMVTSEKETTKELYDAIKEGGGGGGCTVVDVVEKGNMNAVTSNAVAWALGENGDVIITTTDFVTEELLSNIVVKLDDETKTTDESGTCIFQNVAYGTHIIKITNANYEDYVDSIYLKEKSYTYNATLIPIDRDYGTVNVTVVDKDSQVAISDATVQLDTETKTTSTDGKCSFTNIHYGIYDLQVTHNNYETVVDTVELKESSVDVTVEMKADDSKGNLNISVIDSTTLDGIESATVEVGDNTQVTDENGDCTFKDLKYDQYSLNVEHEDYNTYSSFININQEETNITIKMSSVSKTGSIHLTVLDNVTNDPIVNALVTINDTIKVTGATGECTFENLPYSTYAVEIKHDNYDEYVDSITLNKAEVSYTAKLISTLATVDITVSDDTSKEPIPNASVTIDEKTLTTNSKGQCTFANMNYGDYTIVITHYGYNDYSDVISINSKSIVYNVAMSSSLERGTVNVTVTDRSSTLAVKGATVNLGEHTATSDSEGKCTFKNVLYSTYTLTAKCNGYEEYSDSVEVSSSEVDVSVRLIPVSGYLTFQGQVKDKQGALEQVKVTLNDKYSEYSDADGNYTLLCPANTNDDIFALTFSKQYYASINVNIPKVSGQSEYEVPTQELELNSYPLSSNIIASVKNRKYNSEEYEASKKVKLILQNTNSLSKYTSTSDEYGQLVVKDMSAGSYDLIIDDDTIYKSETQSDVFFIRPDQTLNDLEFILTKIAHEFNLTMQYEDGSAVANRKIEIHEKNQTTVLASGTTDEYGEFIFNIANEPVRELIADVYMTDTRKISKDIGSSSLTGVSVVISDGVGDVDVKVIDFITKSVLENATVTLNNETKTTDSEGKCSFKDLEYGEHDIKVTHDNYNEYNESVTVDADPTDYTAELIPEGKHKFTVYVNYESGEPAYDHKVEIHEKDTATTIIASGTSGCYGHFDFALDDTLDITLYATAYAWGESSSVERELGSSKLKSATITIPDEEQCKITFRVFDDDTKVLLSDAKITVDSRSCTTNSEGQCVFTIPYGKHVLHATRLNYNEYAWRDITVETETNTYDVYLVLKTSMVRFIVTDKLSSQPVANATVTFNNKTAVTDEEGYALFEKIPYQSYYQYTVDHEDYELVKGVGQLAALNVVEIYAELIIANKVTFIVAEDTTGNLISNAKLAIEGQSKYTDENGECTLSRINIGTHDYMIFHDLYEIQTGTCTVEQLFETITLNMTRKLGSLTVNVTNQETGEKAPDVNITLTEEVEGTAATYTGVTDENGVCKFENIKYATYTSLAKHDYFVMDSGHITIKGDYTYNIVLKPRYSDLTLQVVDDDTGKILKGVTVNFGDTTVVTDVDGECSFEKIYTSLYQTWSLSTYHIKYFEYEDEDFQVLSIKQYTTIRLKPGYCKVTVTVYDEVTALEVQNAVVMMGGVTATTAFNGKCTLEKVPYETTLLVVSHKDYDPYTFTRYVPLHQLEYNYNAYISSSKSRGTCNFTIMNGETRELIDVSTIYLDNIRGTTSQGKYSIDNILYGTHDISIYSIGYNQVVGSITLEKSSDTWIFLLNEATGNLEITVIGIDNQSYVSGATVTLDGMEATTDEEGKCYFNDLKYGVKEYTVSHPYYIDISGTITVNTTKSYAKITPQSKTGKVIVTVLDSSSSDPVPNSNVFINSEVKTTNSSGIATFDAVYYTDSQKVKVMNDYYATKEETISVTQEKTEVTIKITHW